MYQVLKYKEKAITSMFTTMRTSNHTPRTSVEKLQFSGHISLIMHFDPEDGGGMKCWFLTIILYS